MEHGDAIRQRSDSKSTGLPPQNRMKLSLDFKGKGGPGRQHDQNKASPPSTIPHSNLESQLDSGN